MTYAQYLLVFLGGPLLALAALTWRRRHAYRARLPWLALVVHAIVAVAYTTPWDNYLVANGVWWYDPQRVLGVVLGWVPLEEYCFFVLQTLLTGLWVIWLGRHSPSPFKGNGRAEGDADGEPSTNASRIHECRVTLANQRSGRYPKMRHMDIRVFVRPYSWMASSGAWRWRPWRPGLVAAGVVALLWLAALAVLLVRRQPGFYLAIELAWFLPPIAVQLVAGADILWRERRLVAAALLPPIAYLAATDAYAIGQGIWAISPQHTLGIEIAGVLPLEELIFFTLTNVLIVFGMTLFLIIGRRSALAQGSYD